MAILIIPVLYLLTLLFGFIGWVNNVIWTFKQDNLVDLALGVLGAIVAPIGAIHGLYVLF